MMGLLCPKKENVVKPAKGSQEKLEGEREKSPRSEPPLKKAKEETPKTDSAKSSSSSQKDEKNMGTPRKAHSKSAKEHQDAKPVKEEKAKKEYPKDGRSEKGAGKEDKAKKPSEKSKPVDSRGEKRKRKTEEKSVDKDFDSSSMKISKLEVTETVKPSPKRKMEPDAEKLDGTPEKDKASSAGPAKKIKLNRETGKKIGSAESVSTAKEPSEKLESASSKVKQEKVKGKVRRKVTGTEGPSSTLVDYPRYLIRAGGLGCWSAERIFLNFIHAGTFY